MINQGFILMKIECNQPCDLKDLYYNDDRMEKYCQNLFKKKNNDRLNNLRPMERMLLPYFGKGLMNKEIAQKFNVSESTIKAHKRNTIKNLGLNNSVELICFIVHCGFI